MGVKQVEKSKGFKLSKLQIKNRGPDRMIEKVKNIASKRVKWINLIFNL